MPHLGQYWLQKNGTAMAPKNSCSYADIFAEHIDNKVVDSKTLYPELRSWFRFRDDTFVLWRGAVQRLHYILYEGVLHSKYKLSSYERSYQY